MRCIPPQALNDLQSYKMLLDDCEDEKITAAAAAQLIGTGSNTPRMLSSRFTALALHRCSLMASDSESHKLHVIADF